jgi:SAM-dependent methyltransferase
MRNPTQRFSSRVENYVRYRPGYPAEILQLLKEECGLTPASIVADIASGTGLLTRMFLENGNRVFGVEPNPEMRQAGERLLAAYPKFVSVAGSAEATTLQDHVVDFVTAAQAAHWFDRQKARQEFARVLKPGGWCVLIWNERRTGSTPFLRDYEKLLLTYGTDYQDVRHEHTTASIHEFFAPSPFQSRFFEMKQRFDYAGVEGRLLSSSYTPQPDHPNYSPMLRELRRLFESHAAGGRVTLEYTTRVYYGHL